MILSRRAAALVAATTLCAATVALAGPAAPARAGTDSVLAVAAGDIACDPRSDAFANGNGAAGECRAKRTSDQILLLHPDAVLPLGDEQYENGRLWKFNRSYGHSWGRVKAITYPAPGNHEYGTYGAADYFSYFGAGAAADPLGPNGSGYYSYDLTLPGDLASWHMVALNANCEEVGGCDAGSPQGQWLQSDLQNDEQSYALLHPLDPVHCTLAYWHQPRFSSGLHGDDLDVAPFWDALYAAGADVVLNGHDHDYERFTPQDPLGNSDGATGIREFVVGTGGRGLRPFTHIAPHSLVRDRRHFGVLRLRLYAGRYSWRFVGIGDSSPVDKGSRSCHGVPAP
jgi:hypothetical protein